MHFPVTNSQQRNAMLPRRARTLAWRQGMHEGRGHKGFGTTGLKFEGKSSSWLFRKPPQTEDRDRDGGGD